MLSPEDIANDAFNRIFKENSNCDEQIRLFVNQKGETGTENVYLKSFPDKQSAMRQQIASRSEQFTRKRHKSPANRHVPVHSPLTKRRSFHFESLNSVRKTKSTALTPTSKFPWESRGITASTPDLNLIYEKTDEKYNQRNYQRNNNCMRGNSVSLTLCYYNLELFNIILNCIIVAIGLIYFGCATAIIFNKDTLLILLSFKMFILSILSLYTTAIILFIIAIGMLCFTCHSPRKTIAYAILALLMASILVSLAFIQNSTEIKIHQNAESQMQSTIQTKSVDRFKDIWDYFQETFKCCGVRGYIDWCKKKNFHSRQNITNGGESLGSLVCAPPSSCCLDYKKDAVLNHSNHRQELCLHSPTPWNSHQIGCIMPIKAEMYFLGKIYRITNFGLAIILLLSATTSVILSSKFLKDEIFPIL